MSSRYLVIEMSTGAMDGIYRFKLGAEDALRAMRRRHPGGTWVLAEVLSGEPFHLPDARFHRNLLEYKQ